MKNWLRSILRFGGLTDFVRMAGLYAVVDAEVCRRRGVVLRAFAEGLRAAGVGWVQWRDKLGSPQEVLAGAAVLREVFAGSGCRLIMNDRADLAVIAGFDGVHVGQGDLPVEDARRVLGSGPTHRVGQRHDEWGMELGWVVGVSTHREAEVRAAELSSADYVAIGPVFETATKADAEPVVGLEEVRRARGLTGKPLVAIGGITRANCRSVVEAGADAVAVVSGLFGEEGEEVVAREFVATISPRGDQ